jgi:hypothetical protein
VEKQDYKGIKQTITITVSAVIEEEEDKEE